MEYTLEFTEDSRRQLAQLSAHDRTVLLAAMATQLGHQPTKETRNRKRLRQVSLADWELRVGKYRVFYRVEEARVTVLVVAIGAKDHNQLRIEGKEYKL